MNRLNDLLIAAKFDNWYSKGHPFRVELLRAIRKFAVACGDLELESACDERIALELE